MGIVVAMPMGLEATIPSGSVISGRGARDGLRHRVHLHRWVSDLSAKLAPMAGHLRMVHGIFGASPLAHNSNAAMQHYHPAHRVHLSQRSRTSRPTGNGEFR
jgi:hypothetical protein